MMKSVLILGATGRIGRILSRNLLHKDVGLTLYVRDESKLPDDIKKVGNIFTGDVLDYGKLLRAMKGIDIVVAVLSGNLLSMADNIVKAMRERDVSYVLWVTGLGIHHEVPGEVGNMLDRLLRQYPEYAYAADTIASCGIPYTLVRCGHLTDDENEIYYIQEEGQPLHSINTSRACVARFMTDAICGKREFMNQSIGITN